MPDGAASAVAFRERFVGAVLDLRSPFLPAAPSFESTPSDAATQLAAAPVDIASRSRDLRETPPDFERPGEDFAPFRLLNLPAPSFVLQTGACVPPPSRPPSNGGPPPEPSVSLPMMRSATSHTASMAPTISCLPTTTSSRRHSSCAVTPGIDQRRIGLLQHAEQF